MKEDKLLNGDYSFFLPKRKNKITKFATVAPHCYDAEHKKEII